ncbi:MAG: DEAD/DEAH box helicase family protein, partial [Lentisphaeria bacterium]|nr:DEAD/DEAH box helicase family protein [Lentisphaeria bacterium]
MPDFKLIHGIYENVITHALEERLERISDSFDVEKSQLDSDESAFVLALHLTKLLANSLASIKGNNQKQRQAQLCNQLLEVIGKNDSTFPVEAEKIVEDLMYLLKIQDRGRKSLSRPDTPLTNAALFTGTASDLSLEGELKKEIQTADHIDILCSFIRWSGLRLLLPHLQEATADGKRLRIITTSYLGATDIKAIDALQKLPNTELLVSYDTERTRLHAKSYIFHRDNGFGTAYIGSSNISAPALTSGLEWNVKISQFESTYLWDKVCATFETYQNTPEFSHYDESSREKLARALAHEAGGTQAGNNTMVFMDVTPYPYQEEILDKIRAERELHGRYQNLVIAATGTGKTIIAAFDFLRVRKKQPHATFLFVVHREEILTKSQLTFRQILRDQNFGELLVGSYKPNSLGQLFCSIQSLNSNALCRKLSADYYDYIIIDEFHHAAADSYQELLEHFKPKYLLALTATPERHDGLDVLKYFNYHIAAEIRLPDAINKKLLSPFQYFGISDCVDLSTLRWVNGAYDKTQLNSIFSGNAQRACLVVQKMNELLLDIAQCRALCFCVSQDHAVFMDEFFRGHGIHSAVLTANSNAVERNSVQQRLRDREINVLCVVDLYNEGVDIPEIDTVLFLRPTESLTVFLQQLGRGLRLSEDKECLTVLDFVGNAHKNFSFEYRFRAMLGASGQNVADELEHGFPHLPAGCHIELEKEAQKRILANISEGINNGRQNMLISRIATFQNESGKPPTLNDFLDYHHLPPSAIYKKALFARLCQKANLHANFSIQDEDRLCKGLLRICHMNSAYQLKTLYELLGNSPKRLSELSNNETRLLTMLHFSLWTPSSSIPTLQESIARLKANGLFYDELLALIDYLYEHTDLVTTKPLLWLDRRFD